MRMRSKGFTLIEVMVVLVVIGVIATMTTLSLEGVRVREQDAEVQRLRLMLERAAERAEITSTPIAVDLLAHSYRFSSAHAGNDWRLMFEPRAFAERMWRSDVKVLSLEVDGQIVAPPYRIVFSSEAPEYRLRVRTDSASYVLNGRISGAVDIEQADAVGS